MLRVLIFALITAYVQCIVILKCCPRGKSLNEKLICEEDTTYRQWEPSFYSPKNSILHPPFTVPPNFTFTENVIPVCRSNHTEAVYLNYQYYVVIFENTGDLFVNYGNSDLIVTPEDFCVSPKGTVICVDKSVLDIKKKMEKNIRKCCLLEAVFSEERNSCVTQNDSKNMNFLSEDTFIHSGFPDCGSREEYSISGKLDEGYSLNMDGTLISNTSQTLANYCVEYILERPKEKASIFTCGPSISPEEDDPNNMRYIILPGCLFISVFFLTITLISTFMLPGSYHALHWKCQTHYIVCLLIGDLLLGITQLYSELLRDTIFCPLTATAAQFFLLAAFFWLNTMCFNIWWTFRDLRPSVDKGQETYRLVLYRLYAWGIPLIIVVFGVLMDRVFVEKYPIALRPNFGKTKCWFKGYWEMAVYFYAPMGFLQLVNLLLFMATTRELTCGLWKREGVKSSTERTALSHVCLKLVIVMGITWIAEVLSYAIQGPAYLWYFTDLVNALQGVFVFIVVGCQPQIWNAVKRKWFLTDSSSRNGVSSNATPSVFDTPSNKQTAVETLC